LSLETIVGPPNSGRAGEVLRRLAGRLDEAPVLAVPTADDTAQFERALCAAGDPVVGATIRTFGGLARDVAGSAGAAHPPVLSPAQRLALIRAAISGTQLGVLRRSAAAPGFAGALDALVAELQAAMVSPADLRDAAAAAPGESKLELELATLYGEYERLRDGAGRADSAAVITAAAAAIRADPGAWASRPVIVYGFDDLTEAQLDLLDALAGACDVTVAVSYADRRALAARARLLARLEEEMGATRVAALDFDPAYTRSLSLRHLGTSLFEAEAGRVEADQGLRLLDCAGERGEAEAVGLEIARLIASGADPQGIVVVLRQPAAAGRLFAAVLRGLGIPVALEAPVPIGATAVGQALIRLCRAAGPEGEPDDLIAHLRADPAQRQGPVDWLERSVARGDADSIDALTRLWEHPPANLARVLEATGPEERLIAVATAARRLAEGVHRERAPLVRERSEGAPLDPIELRAGIAAAELLEELALAGRLPGCEAPNLEQAAEALASATVPAWTGPAEGRVRILSPYRARAGAATHLFCCGLQEGLFPGRGAIDPLLGEQARARLGIPALRRREQADEERYLFGVCVSRPTERLYLSWHSSDEDGHPTPRSPFVDEVLGLVGDGSDSATEAMTTTRGLAKPVPGATEAPTERALARGLVLAAGLDEERCRELLAAIGADLATTAEVLALTAGLPDPAARPGPLEHPLVLEALRSRRHVSANSLEGWIQCSYQWFVDHELAPQALEPEADPLWLGSVVHDALQRLYEEAPGADSIPRPGDVGDWKSRLADLLEEGAAKAGGPITAERRIALARLGVQLDAFLESEAASETSLRPRPDLLERGFGFDEEGDAGELDLGDFALRGRIDRIDVEPGGTRALLRDYKTSRSVPGVTGIANEGKLQLQLYMLVARERLGLDPVGGLYQPLGAYGDRRPRGILLSSECGAGGALDGLEISKKGDALDEEAFTATLDGALEAARTNGARMRAGDIRRDPLGNVCSKYCTFQPICRLERAIGLEEEREVEQ
jgi:ATP-dependent helicase/DNAse subunit B